MLGLNWKYREVQAKTFLGQFILFASFECGGKAMAEFWFVWVEEILECHDC